MSEVETDLTGGSREEEAEKAELSAKESRRAAKPKRINKEPDLSEFRGVWVFIEQNEGRIARVSLELLGAGRQLADKRGVPLAGVLIGASVKALASEAIAYGADLVYVYEDPVFVHYRTESYMRPVIACTRKYKPEIFLYGATSTGKDLASAVATDLATGLTADTTILDVDVETGLLEASRPAFGGNIMATILCKNDRPQMATVRPKVMQALEPNWQRQGKVIEEHLLLREEDLRTKVLEIVRETTRKVRIDEADIIVAGGKGLGGPKGFELIAKLAEAVGGSVGASRDAVEAGWIGHEHQVGQTGVTVTPKIYLAIGISGAVQHLVGMQNSGMIVAINNDPSAAIFGSSHYGIVGDAFEIVPLLIEAFQDARQEEVHHA
jgi:electron transfer flavoprotein alpha subunit